MTKDYFNAGMVAFIVFFFLIVVCLAILAGYGFYTFFFSNCQ